MSRVTDPPGVLDRAQVPYGFPELELGYSGVADESWYEHNSSATSGSSVRGRLQHCVSLHQHHLILLSPGGERGRTNGFRRWTRFNSSFSPRGKSGDRTHDLFVIPVSGFHAGRLTRRAGRVHWQSALPLRYLPWCPMCRTRHTATRYPCLCMRCTFLFCYRAGHQRWYPTSRNRISDFAPCRTDRHRFPCKYCTLPRHITILLYSVESCRSTPCS